MKILIQWFCASLFLFPWPVAGADFPILRTVSVSPTFFNPSLGQQETIRVQVAHAGRLSVLILDRDRFVIRHLGERSVTASEAVFAWDGKDDIEATVPDEAYSIKIVWSDSGRRQEIYDPSAHFTPVLEEPASPAFSSRAGVLSYTLSRPSRVHVQAGQAKRNAKTGEVEGPILKTIVDREPRVAGSVIEQWNGMDESGTVSIPGLPDFSVSITVGNRRQAFRSYARSHRPPDAVQASAHAPVVAVPHHSGLNALEDWSPRVELTPLSVGPGWEKGGVWVVDRPLRLRVEIAEDPAHFLSQPTAFILFVDEQPILRQERPQHPLELTIDPARLSPGEHRIVVNWASELGPVAVGVARVVVHPSPSEGMK
jgi:hypothetical protein